MSNNKSASTGSSEDSLAHPHRLLIRSTTILSLGTLTSRILGFIRDVVIARLLGTGMIADAFFVALKIPNLFRELVAEGATNSAIVPVLSEYVHKKNKEELWNFVSAFFSLALLILSAITIVGIVLSPWLVRGIAPGFIGNKEQLALTIFLTKLMFPYLILIGITAYATGILFTFRSFVVPAFSSCLLNVAMIVSALVASQTMAEPVLGLAIGVLIGGVLQLLVHVKPLLALGVKFNKPHSLFHPATIKIKNLLLPRLFGAGLYQLGVFIDTLCASLAFIVGPGAISAIYYANRLMQLPMGVFGVAMSSALLPTLSTYAHDKDFASFRKTLLFSLENIFFIMFPTAVIILCLSFPMVRILFERGEFDRYSTTITASALSCYALGLMSYGASKILVTAFYALQDTKTPVKITGLCLVLNAALNFALMIPLKVSGIALASALCATLNFFLLLRLINNRVGDMQRELFSYSIKVAGVASLTAILEYVSWKYIFMDNEFIKLIVIGGGGFIFYLTLSYVANIKQAKNILEWLRAGKWRI